MEIHSDEPPQQHSDLDIQTFEEMLEALLGEEDFESPDGTDEEMPPPPPLSSPPPPSPPPPPVLGPEDPPRRISKKSSPPPPEPEPGGVLPELRTVQSTTQGIFDGDMRAVCAGLQWGSGRFKWSAADKSAPYGSISAICAHHRLNKRTGCVKEIGLKSRKLDHVTAVLWTLKHWLNRAPEFSRQRYHMYPRRLDVNATPHPRVVVAQKLADTPPPDVETDVDLDAREGRQPNAPPGGESSVRPAPAAPVSHPRAPDTVNDHDSLSAGAVAPAPADDAEDDDGGSSARSAADSVSLTGGWIPESLESSESSD